jgi:hypothetical protein
MSDEYQRGTDREWLEHSNQEMAKMMKKRDRAIWTYRFLSALFFFSTLIMGFMLNKINKIHPIRELLGF